MWEVEGLTFSRQSAHRWRYGCLPYAPAVFYPPGKFLILLSVRGWVDLRAIVLLEGLDQLKNPMTSSGFEQATFRLVVPQPTTLPRDKNPLKWTLLQLNSYSTTGCLPPINSSWRQAAWDPRPEISFNWTVTAIVLTWHPIWPEDGFVFMNMLGLSSSVRFALIECYWKFLLLRYMQVLCQYRLYRVDHARLTYLMLQRQLIHLNGRKLDHRKV
jgi:hypothetical protein